MDIPIITKEDIDNATYDPKDYPGLEKELLQTKSLIHTDGKVYVLSYKVFKGQMFVIGFHKGQ